MGYDAMGDITSRSDIAGGAAWTYDPVRKHEVLQAGSAANTYTYDPNGNASTRNGYTVGWTSYNYPTSLTTATESVSYSYGPDRQRWKETYTSSSGTETTYRAGKLFEVAYYAEPNLGVLAHYRHYVYAGNELVSIDDRSTAAAPLYYVVSDHQGSYSSIETGANPGTNFVSESFTPFGNRRSGESWSGAPGADESNINIVSRRGFTDESTLGVSMGLNHLNGRVEDSITGRFISADPLGIDPANTQSYNRYSYVLNNPLTHTDPSGFCYTGAPLARCLPYGGGHGDRSNVIGQGDSSRSISGSGFGEGSISNYSFYGITTAGTNWYDWTDDDDDSSSSTNNVGTSASNQAPASGASSSSGQSSSGSNQSQAQGTDSNSSLDYIQITATRISFDPTTGTVSVIVNAGGTGGRFTPFANSANSASFDSERAIDAFNNANQAYAAGDLGEYGRQMDLYYKYSGCSCGPVYLNNPQTAGPLSPMGPPAVQIPPPQMPPIQISPPAPISP